MRLRVTNKRGDFYFWMVEGWGGGALVGGYRCVSGTHSVLDVKEGHMASAGEGVKACGNVYITMCDVEK